MEHHAHDDREHHREAGSEQGGRTRESAAPASAVTIRITSRPSSSTPLKATVRRGPVGAVGRSGGERLALLQVLGVGRGARPPARQPQHALAQPLEPEQQQGHSDHELQRLGGEPGHEHRPEQGAGQHAHDHRRGRADHGVARAPADRDREHDRQRLEQLERHGQHGPEQGEHERHARRMAEPGAEEDGPCPT